MDLAALTHSIKAHYYLFKLTQLFLSVSVCSIIVSPSSLLIFFHYFKFYFSTFPFQLFTHNVDKNCMFLLCNGLLVFVGITKSFYGSSGDHEPSKYTEEGSQSQFSDVEANKPMLEIVAEDKTSEPDELNTVAEEAIEIKNCYEEEVQENIEKIILVDEAQGKGSSQLVLKEEEKDLDEEEVFDAEDEDEDKESENDYVLIEENIDEEEDVEEESCTLSTEELNKKFDDFIRKMKEGLRVEARRQLVVV
ncbi:uncharacterized protein LOC133291704 [Gastrolobium bilobum]|uniref:uncharacterized protein LOC133291704 n=1 Tax=Gastrolobium bilobum TaxID=150636 RepID=UPI002AB21E42|nr:uncharacterized protein LOC133291704 [Gastrolobium bilobum]